MVVFESFVLIALRGARGRRLAGEEKRGGQVVRCLLHVRVLLVPISVCSSLCCVVSLVVLLFGVRCVSSVGNSQKEAAEEQTETISQNKQSEDTHGTRNETTHTRRHAASIDVWLGVLIAHLLVCVWLYVCVVVFGVFLSSFVLSLLFREESVAGTVVDCHSE